MKPAALVPTVPRSTPLKAELAALLRLAGPVVVVQVGLMSMGIVDTVLVGHVEPESFAAVALASVALGNTYGFGVQAFGFGTLMALDPLVAQALGAGDRDGAARALQRGLVLALLLSFPTIAVMLLGLPLLKMLHQPLAVVPLAASYAAITAIGAPAFFAFIVLRQTLQAMHRTAAILTAVVVANVANALLCWALVYGRLGLPAMGVAGAAWATAACRWLMVLVLLAVGWRSLVPFLSPWRRDGMGLRPIGRMFLLGAPIGGQFIAEIGAFSIVALLMGWLGTREVASQQVAINLASFSFMLPLGIASAASVRVGHAVGRADVAGARRSAGLALACGAGVMLLCAATFLSIPRLLASIFTRDMAVIALAAQLISVAGVFQVFDGIQVVAVGVLRGTGDTRTPIVVNLVGFGLLGLPLGLWLAFGAPHGGAVGLWWGLVAGLAVVAIVLLWRVRTRLGQQVRRLSIDH